MQSPPLKKEQLIHLAVCNCVSVWNIPCHTVQMHLGWHVKVHMSNILSAILDTRRDIHTCPSIPLCCHGSPVKGNALCRANAMKKHELDATVAEH